MDTLIRTCAASLLLAPSIVAAADDWSLADWAWDYFIEGATLKPGVGTRSAGIRVVRVSDNAEGKIVHRDEMSYFLQYSTSPIYFSIQKTGLTFIFNISGFDADQQEIANDSFFDLGTRMDGRFFYVVPTAFYEWGDYTTGNYARIGIGIGAGIANFDGDVVLTTSPANDVVQLEQTGTEITSATSLIIEGHWRNWGLTIQYAGPVYETDEYQINVEDVSVNLGYQFVF